MVDENTPRATSRGPLGTVLRVWMHALLLAAVGLLAAVTSFAPPAATAQGEAALPEATAPAPAQVPAQALPAEVQLNLGSTAQLDGGRIQLTLRQVAEDSRCPMNVMCVWAGRATVWLAVEVDGVSQGEVDVSLYPGRQSTATTDADAVVGRYVISLVDLQPYPVAGQPLPLGQKTATIRVGSEQ